MAGAKEIRGKIASIKNTQKITKAMEMVAASKMRKAQDRMRAARPYAEKVRKMIGHLRQVNLDYKHPFTLERPVTSVGIVVISTDRGLAGSMEGHAAMDMSIQLRTPAARVCTLSLSFNNDGPLGTFFRYICDNGTYIARYDDLVTGREEPVDVSKVDVSTNGIELHTELAREV